MKYIPLGAVVKLHYKGESRKKCMYRIVRRRILFPGTERYWVNPQEYFTQVTSGGEMRFIRLNSKEEPVKSFLLTGVDVQ